MLSLIKQVWINISLARKKLFILLIVLMIFSSFAEVLSIGMVFPFLAALADPGAVYNSPYMQSFVNFLEIETEEQLVFPLTIIFAFSALFAGLMRILLLYLSTYFSYLVGSDFSYSAYSKTLYQEYSMHINRNSSEVINGIVNKVNTVVNQVVFPLITILSSIILFFGILSVLLIINPYVTAFLLFGFTIIYLLIIKSTKSLLRRNSKSIAINSDIAVQAIQEGLGGIRDILIDNNQKLYSNNFRIADLSMRRAQGLNQFISGAPRFIVESLGMVIIAFLAFKLINQGQEISSAIALLGAVAIGAQRLMPILQQSYFAFANMSGSKDSLIDVLALLDQPLPEYVFSQNNSNDQIEFNNEILLKNIAFSYLDGVTVFKNINLEIKKGSIIGIVGETGSGKSTLVDIIMGLLSPSKGEIIIDGTVVAKNNRHIWRKNISHVPQHIYLSDSSIAENIAFGQKKKNIDLNRMKQAAKYAEISDDVETFQNGYNTLVGEDGIKLSGGQRQRIGVARALYKGSDILIFDEATSALDNETERNLMRTINKLENLTIIIIAHRLTTLNKCNVIYEISKNEFKDVTKEIIDI